LLNGYGRQKDSIQTDVEGSREKHAAGNPAEKGITSSRLQVQNPFKALARFSGYGFTKAQDRDFRSRLLLARPRMWIVVYTFHPNGFLG
jgi:hypothetical protein